MPSIRIICYLLLSFTCHLGVKAQNQGPNQNSYHLAIKRLSGSTVVLDGQLNEECWSQAAMADNFWEKDPRDDVRAELATTAQLTYDDNYLYVAIRCYDKDQNHIISTLKRDNDYWDGDGVAVILDPVNEASNGFMFGVNPLGVQMEALLGGGSGDGNFNSDWDNIWRAETAQYEDHWVVEMAIPFKTLRYEEGATVWGINFLRNDTKHNRFFVWAPIPRQFWGIDLGYTGQLQWDQAPPVAKSNVTLIPYVSTGRVEDYEEGETTNQLNAGIDAKIALSPSLNLDLTVNPDFSQVDVDVQVTNLSRFSIFFPERRNFFLENSDLFSSFGIPPLRPFFSRRIGIDDEGQAVPVLFGARLTGNATDDLRIGIMDVQTQGNENQAAQNYFTAAFSQRIFQRSSIRGMLINRQGIDREGIQKDNYNRNADLEFNYQSADGKFESWTGYHHSFYNEIETKNNFYNVGGAYTSPNINFVVDWVNVGENYFADVGFTNRIENYDAARDTTIRQGYKILYTPFNITLLPKSDRIQNLNINLENAYFLNDDYSLNERSSSALLGMEFPNSASLVFGTVNAAVELRYPFNFTDGEPLPAGRYNFQDVGFFYSSDERKRLSYGVGAEAGGFYSGSRRKVTGRVSYRAQPWGNFAVTAEYNSLEFPAPHGKEELWLLGPRLEFNFSKNLFWTTFLQYNTQADNFNINSRLQWQFRPLSWFFLVFTDNYAVNVWGPKNRALVAKLNYWLSI